MTDLKHLFLSMQAKLARAVGNIVPVHDVEDVVQETYVKLCLVRNEETIEHPRSYLYQMARNLAKDRIKNANTALCDHPGEEALLNYSDGRDETYASAVSRQEFERFCESVRSLPLQCRRAFVLRKVYGFTQREIAQELGIAESTVEKHVALGLRRCAQQRRSQQSGNEPRPSMGKRKS